MKHLIILILFALAFSPAASAQATRPADANDQSTQSILKELDATAAAAPQNPTTAPAQSDSSAHFDQDGLHIDWASLIHNFEYMLITAAALGMAASVLGLFVLLRREALVALAIPQVVAVGVAIGMRFWGENHTLPPAMAVAFVALVYFALSRRWGASNWIIPSFYVAGMCLSFLIIANHGQDVEDLQHRLSGGVDVAISKDQMILAVPILLAAGLACALLWRRWLLLAQAPAAAELAGLRPARWDTLFLVLLTVATLLGTDSVGVVMVLSMLFLPAATVLPWVRRIPAAMVAGAVLALVYLALGFYLSIRMNWPLSQSVGGAGFTVLAISQLTAQLKG